MVVRFAEKFSVKTGRLPAMPGFQPGQAERLPSSQVLDAPEGFVKQTDMNMFSLQAMIVVQPLGINQGSAALPVFGNDLFASRGADLFTEFRQFGTRVTERDDVLGRNGHKILLVGQGLYFLYRILSTPGQVRGLLSPNP